MCGRYSLAIRPAQIQARLRNDNLRVDRMFSQINSSRQSHNVAPGYIEPVYRAVVHEESEAGPAEDEDVEPNKDGVDYVLQGMKWGLIPSWTKRNPDYSSLLKTINCRDDSLFENSGMWNSMKHRKRCVVPIEGFYEWQKQGKQRIPYYIKDPGTSLLYAAGLWDSVTYEGTTEPVYTFTIITTVSNKDLKFLHDRMPVFLRPGSDEMRAWLDPKNTSWDATLQGLLQPYSGELMIFRVSQDVNKVGNDSEHLVVPLDQLRGGIKSFFGAPSQKDAPLNKSEDEKKRKLPVDIDKDETAHKHLKLNDKESTFEKSQKLEEKPLPQQKQTRSATTNPKQPQPKPKGRDKAAAGTPKITSFFKK